MTRAVRALVVDLGGVACRFQPERRLAALAATTGQLEEDIAAAIWGPGAIDEKAERGRLSKAETYHALISALGGALSPEQLRAIWALAFEPDPAVLDALARVPCDRALFTNNGPVLEDCLAHELAELASNLEHTFLSCHLRARKPEAKAYERVTVQLGVPPETILFLDDALPNVEAAQAIGWQAIRYDASDPSALGPIMAAAGWNAAP